MEVKEIEVTKKEKIYTLTEFEYNDLKCKERGYGSRKTREYIGFCWNNYICKKDVDGCFDFIGDLLKFLQYDTETIPNKYGLSLFEWLKNNS